MSLGHFVNCSPGGAAPSPRNPDTRSRVTLRSTRATPTSGSRAVLGIGGDCEQLLDATACDRGDNAHSDHEFASAPSFFDLRNEDFGQLSFTVIRWRRVVVDDAWSRQTLD